jgi:hypothetical protein
MALYSIVRALPFNGISLPDIFGAENGGVGGETFRLQGLRKQTIVKDGLKFQVSCLRFQSRSKDSEFQRG